jgi:hypothetical protein
MKANITCIMGVIYCVSKNLIKTAIKLIIKFSEESNWFKYIQLYHFDDYKFT